MYGRVMTDVGEFLVFHQNWVPRDDLKMKMVDYTSCFFHHWLKYFYLNPALLVD